jgi:hypothetical protein
MPWLLLNLRPKLRDLKSSRNKILRGAEKSENFRLKVSLAHD